MSVPDQLVQAAAEAKCLHARTLHAPEGEWFVLRDGTTTTEYRERGCEGKELKHPECALAAAFAALPECPEAEVAVVEGISDRYPRRVIEHEIGHVVLAALAREFGEKD